MLWSNFVRYFLFLSSNDEDVVGVLQYLILLKSAENYNYTQTLFCLHAHTCSRKLHIHPTYSQLLEYCTMHLEGGSWSIGLRQLKDRVAFIA